MHFSKIALKKRIMSAFLHMRAHINDYTSVVVSAKISGRETYLKHTDFYARDSFWKSPLSTSRLFYL